MSSQLHAPAVLPQGKSHWCLLDRRLCRPQSRCGRGNLFSCLIMIGDVSHSFKINGKFAYQIFSVLENRRDDTSFLSDDKRFQNLLFELLFVSVLPGCQIFNLISKEIVDCRFSTSYLLLPYSYTTEGTDNCMLP